MPAPRPSRRPLLAAVVAGALLSPLPGVLLPQAQADGARPAAATGLGHDRIGVRRGDTWHLRDALDGGPHRSYRQGPAGWTAVAGDLDGDGVGTVSLFRDGYWLLRDRDSGLPTIVRHGRAGDRPVVGDWDGDGVDTIGVFRAGTWVLRATNGLLPAPDRVFAFGMAGDVPVVGDWNGDGRDDVAVRRGGRWFQRDAASAGRATRSFDFGLPRDVPVSGDWDHDGADTPGLFRDGTWFFLRDNGRSPYQTTRFGLRGDQPVVRRTPSLAPGVTHHVLRDRRARWVAHVARVDLAAASSPETVLAGDRLRGKDTVSAMTRRAGAVLGVNGDFFLGNGRPVHLYANDGVLLQTPSILGRAFSLDATGTRFSMGYPDVRTRVTAGAALVDVGRVNQGAPGAGDVAGFSAAGSGLEAPPAGRCSVTLRPDGARAVRPDGRVVTPLTVGESRCGGPRPAVPRVGTVLSAEPAGPGGAQLRALPRGTRATLTTQLGFPGAVDAMGGNPLLVVDGRVVASEVDGTAPFFARASRTAVGVTARGTLLVVVVDGRQPGWSDGMTLRQLAELMHRLGAHSALNLDGGGSSEMVLNGLVVNRPSDGRERPVANALVVLPGADAGQADLLGTTTPARPGPAQGPAADALPGPEVRDPASVGGLADALRRSGTPLPPELAAVADLLPG